MEKALVLETKGKIFSCDFYKKDGSPRHLAGRLGVHKGVVGAGASLDPIKWAHLQKVYDMQKHEWRTVNLETVWAFTCGKVRYVKIDPSKN
jgi:hypothetical protein